MSNDNITIAKTSRIRDSKLDEFWLQEKICENPSILTLGNLNVVYKETESGGGRLDILLIDRSDDTMYEVEVMLGKTDESHIVRTIAYWDNEQRKWPQRQHFAVLVAESFEKDFFRIIYRFSHSIPIIAIQVNMVEVAGNKALHFSKIIDTFTEPEEEPEKEYKKIDEADWNESSPSSLEAAKILHEIVKPIYPDSKLHYVQNYISILVKGKSRFAVRKRPANQSEIRVWCSDKMKVKATELFADKKTRFRA